MNKNKLNFIALCLITLFLLDGFAAEKVFCQKPDKNFLQTTETKPERTAFNRFKSKTQTNLFTKESFPAGKASLPPDALSSQPATTYTRPNADERLKKYLKRAFGVYALLGDAASAGVSQAIDSPEEWENNGKGYARRFASAVGRSAITETATYGLDEALKLDSGFYKSGKRKFGDRLGNAFLSTFAARKPDGRHVVGIPRIAGTYASGIIAAETWYPKTYNYKDGFRLGTISLGVDFGVNILREFFLGK